MKRTPVTLSRPKKTFEHTGRGGVWWPDRRAISPPENLTIDVLIPALNEEESLPMVLSEIPANWVRRVVVVDNGSEDRTAVLARALGAVVVFEPQRGYGAACLAGLSLAPFVRRAARGACRLASLAVRGVVKFARVVRLLGVRPSGFRAAVILFDCEANGLRRSRLCELLVHDE